MKKTEDSLKNVRLTNREKEALNHLSCGCTNQEIAQAMGISLSGAKWYAQVLRQKLQVKTRGKAAKLGLELGLIDATPANKKSDLVWTDKPPTEPGRYLCLYNGKEYVGYAKNSNFSGRLCYWGVDALGDRVFFMLDEVGRKWAGPLPCPTEVSE